MITPRKPVVFIHGLWLHATSWQNWVDLFREEGFDPLAPEWPGVAETVEGTRASPQSQAGKGIDDVVNHYAQIIRGLETKPIVIGHSFGGLFTQKLLGQDLAAGAVAIDPAPIRGVMILPPAQLRSAFPGLRNPANRKRTVTLSPKQFRYGFTNAVSEQESAELYDKWAIPGPGRPLFEAAFANFSPNSPAKVNTRNSSRGPLLLISGKLDHTVPDVVTRSTFKQYRHSTAITDLEQIDNRGHSLTIDSGWRDVANITLNWLKQRGL